MNRKLYKFLQLLPETFVVKTLIEKARDERWKLRTLPDFGVVYLGDEDAIFILESCGQGKLDRVIVVWMTVDMGGKVVFDGLLKQGVD